MRKLYCACFALTGMLVGSEFVEGLSTDTVRKLRTFDVENSNKIKDSDKLEADQITEWYEEKKNELLKSEGEFVIIESIDEKDFNLYYKIKNDQGTYISARSTHGIQPCKVCFDHSVIENQPNVGLSRTDLGSQKAFHILEFTFTTNSLKITSFGGNFYISNADMSVPVLIKGSNIGVVGQNKFSKVGLFATNTLTNYGNIEAPDIALGSFHQNHLGSINGTSPVINPVQFEGIITNTSAFEGFLKDLESKHNRNSNQSKVGFFNLGGEINANEVKIKGFDCFDYAGRINVNSLVQDGSKFYTYSSELEGAAHNIFFNFVHPKLGYKVSITNPENTEIYFDNIKQDTSNNLPFNRDADLGQVVFKGVTSNNDSTFINDIFGLGDMKSSWQIKRQHDKWVLAKDNKVCTIEAVNAEKASTDKMVCTWWKLSLSSTLFNPVEMSNEGWLCYRPSSKKDNVKPCTLDVVNALQSLIPLSSFSEQMRLKNLRNFSHSSKDPHAIHLNNGETLYVPEGYNLVSLTKGGKDYVQSMDGLRYLLIPDGYEPVYDEKGQVVFSNTKCNAVYCVPEHHIATYKNARYTELPPAREVQMEDGVEVVSRKDPNFKEGYKWVSRTKGGKDYIMDGSRYLFIPEDYEPVYDKEDKVVLSQNKVCCVPEGQEIVYDDDDQLQEKPWEKRMEDGVEVESKKHTLMVVGSVMTTMMIR